MPYILIGIFVFIFFTAIVITNALDIDEAVNAWIEEEYGSEEVIDNDREL